MAASWFTEPCLSRDARRVIGDKYLASIPDELCQSRGNRHVVGSHGCHTDETMLERKSKEGGR